MWRDWLDDGYIEDEDGLRDPPHVNPRRECKFCNVGRLRWVKHGRWTLVDENGKKHNCGEPS